VVMYVGMNETHVCANSNKCAKCAMYARCMPVQSMQEVCQIEFAREPRQGYRVAVKVA
jgi:hypothetical protein